MSLRVLLSGARIGRMPSPAYVYRINEDSKSQTSKPSRGFRELRNIHLRNAARPNLPLTIRGLLLARAARWLREALAHRFDTLTKGRRSGQERDHSS